MSLTHLPRQPVPLFVPTLAAALVLLVLFFFGWREQRQLASAHAEQVLSQREEIAHIVAEAMERDLRQTAASIERFAHDLSAVLAPDWRVSPDQVQQRFDQQFERWPDGSIRSRRDRFDGSRQAGVVIPSFLQPDGRLQEFFLRTQAFTEHFGRGAQGQRFVDTWLLPAPGGEVIFWPEQPSFIYDAPADFDYRDTEWVTLTQPDHNPNRRVYWTKLAYDPVPQVWMLSAVAPLYWRGEWLGSVGHDVPLALLLARTDLLRQQSGSQFILLTAEGVVAASDVYAKAIQDSKGMLNLSQLPDKVWQRVLSVAPSTGAEAPRHQRVSVEGHIAFISRVGEQNWLLINLIPLLPVSAPIDDSFTNLRNITLATLLLVLLIATALLAWARHRSRQYFLNLNAVQQKLAVSEAHYRSLVANIPGMVYRCANDQDWTMSFVSPAAAELTGYPEGDFIGNRIRSFASIIHPDDQQRVFDTVQRAIAQQQPFTIEYRIQHRDGQLRSVLEYGRPILLDDVMEALEGVILDVTPLKQAEAELRELNSSLELQVDRRTAELRSAIKELETFNYAVSHDLRAPVRHVDGYLSMLQEVLLAHPDASAQELIGRCQRALKRMSEMIAGMLALAQLGRASLHSQPVDLAALVQEILDEMPASSRQQLRTEIGALPVVVADRVLLRQVLQNLIDNAVKYSQKSPSPLLAIQDRSSSSEFIIEIRDNGVGFDSQLAGNLFTLFRRLHSAEEFAGTGVGLALSAKIIDLHGGRIWAESKPEQGARFFITLPRSAVAAASNLG